MVWYGMAWHGMVGVWYVMAYRGMACYGGDMAWYDRNMVCHGMVGVWYVMA